MIVLFFKAPKAFKPLDAPLKEKILQLDFNGAALFLTGMVCLLLPLQWGGVTRPWSSPSVIACLTLFGILTIAFIANELWMADRALMVPRLLSTKTLALSALYSLFNSASFFILIYYLPIYFQAIHNTTASGSGVRNLPYILSVGICSILSGLTITLTGHYSTLMLFGSALTTLGTGLIYTLTLTSPAARWIGYQILAGIGTGSALQIPIIVAQATSVPADLSSATAIILFFQLLAGAIFVSVAQALFANGLLSSVSRNVAGVEPAFVVATGAVGLREVFTEAPVLRAVLESFMVGLKNAYVLGIALGGVACVVAGLVVGWGRGSLRGGVEGVEGERVREGERERDEGNGEKEKAKVGGKRAGGVVV